MPTSSTEFRGEPVLCNLVRREDDTDDLTVHITDPVTESDAAVVGWTVTLDISATKGGVPVAGGTFTGTGIAGGNLPIDMNLFALVPATYYHDIRIVDTVTPDTPGRVYFTGKFKVIDRVKT
jgi:hypothetical protein